MTAREKIDTICNTEKLDICKPESSHGFISISEEDNISKMPTYNTHINPENIEPTYYEDLPIIGTSGNKISNNWSNFFSYINLTDPNTSLNIKSILNANRYNNPLNILTGSKQNGTNGDNCNQYTSNALGYGIVNNEISGTAKICYEPIDGANILCACNNKISNYNILYDVPMVKNIYIKDKIGNTEITGEELNSISTREQIDKYCKDNAPIMCKTNKIHGFIGINPEDSIKNMPVKYSLNTNIPIIGNGKIIANKWDDLYTVKAPIKNAKTLSDVLWKSDSNADGSYSSLKYGISCGPNNICNNVTYTPDNNNFSNVTSSITDNDVISYLCICENDSEFIRK